MLSRSSLLYQTLRESVRRVDRDEHYSGDKTNSEV
jgi:hypothetical protein